MFERPKDPNAFLLEELERVQDSKVRGFFTDTDIAACFAALDPHDTGKITSKQYAHALKSLGIESPKKPLEDGAEVVAKDDFMARMSRELAPTPLPAVAPADPTTTLNATRRRPWRRRHHRCRTHRQSLWRRRQRRAR